MIEPRDRWSTLGRVALALTVAVAAWLLWRECGVSPIQDWREADTQTIARHFAEPGSSIFYPRIDWGGAGPGYVEAEFQLYTWLVSWALRAFGDVEWPGKLLSLTATLGTVAVVFRGLERLHGSGAALVGALVLLSSRAVLYVATSVQPEALCLLLYAGAWFAWLRFESAGSVRALVVYAVLGALAMLVKPTAGQLGIASFLLLAFRARERLRQPAVWIAWVAMVAALGLHLWHARNLYLEYGNTFGVLSGGDSKLPRLAQLLSPRIYLATAKNGVLWGTGLVGALAIIVSLVLRRGVPLVSALLVSNLVWTLLALRYTSDAAGNHYHLLASVTAAHASALVVEAAAQARWHRALLIGLGAITLGGLAKALRFQVLNHVNVWNAPAIAAGRALAEVSRPGDLVVIRSVQSDYDPVWRTPNNFQDPRVFYFSRTRGWPLSLDDLEPRSVSDPARAGARYYVETIARPPASSLDGWLERNATLVRTTPHGGRVFALGGR